MAAPLKANAASLAGDRGAEGKQDWRPETVDSADGAGSARAGERIERAARTLRLALIADDPDAWADLAAVWRARLTLRDRAGLAFSALRSLPEDERSVVIEHAAGGAGRPVPPFLDVMREARFWADMPEPAELRAYAVACLNRLSPADRAAILAHVQGRAAA